ncbi:hypothetical protein [Mesorhizobium sp. M00.F.Ca.ET.216.01.1.1]|uniref:hypothetical protein n=1 Tax=Mesorhizobium sp. M00.F.Ca.ET.216.01.1.1 TaxID=2500528 RepID=UPI001093CCEC|nr:hypothetical protein [Mesorhizobium sp. M00.F.Ca.ET.216.01.1.1]TGQ46647.1 hypothetical protein EN859_002975 [Mesorhizobium sp. M00.F.Ca.ET.216.01.1.1]TJW14831.1 MAG: hypothetical protein E5W82_08810 [Mesorhizobium sp.]
MSGPQINKLLRVDQIWMALSVDDNGTEGVCAVLVDDAWMPLVAADKQRLPLLQQQAAIIARRDQRLVRIVRLHDREEVSQVDGRQ